MSQQERSIREYLHLYLGCMVEYPDTDGKKIRAILTYVGVKDVETTYKRARNSLTSAGKIKGDYLSWTPNGWHNSDALHIKPILRSLEDMTEEESARFRKIFSEMADNNKSQGEIWAEQTRLLLLEKYDLFDLIPRGLAVNAKELKA